MNHWLLCVPRKDIEHCLKIGTFGLGRKYILGAVETGDPVACCAGTGDWKIIALGTATSEYYIDDRQIFLKEGDFPDRFDFKAHTLPKDSEVDVVSIIDQLSFVKNLSYWAVFFRAGIVKISKQDWELIIKKAGGLTPTAP